MRNPHGYAIWVDPTGDEPVVERDTIVCRHCQRVVFIEPGKDPSAYGGFCRICMSLICGPCADLGKCVPWEKQLEQAEQREETKRSLGV